MTTACSETRHGAGHHAWRITASGREDAVGRPMARFPWWSFTKTVIAAVALRLAERGDLDLDAPEPDGHTLRQLLAHTAGLPDYGGLDAYHRAVAAGARPWPRAEMLDRAMVGGRLFAPGTGWSYSNIGYMLARERIEAAANRSLAELVQHLVTAPLGLASVTLPDSRAAFAQLHWPEAAGYDPGWVYHGCLAGTARDAAWLLHRLISGDLLDAESLQQMMAARPLGGALIGRPWTVCGYGLGLMLGQMGAAGRAIGHSGAGPFGGLAVYHFPDLDDPATVACFAPGPDEGVAEYRAWALAQGR